MHLWMPSGTIDPCCKVHEVDITTFPCSFEVGNRMVYRVVQDFPCMSSGFAGYFPHFCRPTHTKSTYIYVTWLCQRDDSTATHATNGIREIIQSTKMQITHVNVSFAVISALDVNPVPWKSSQPWDLRNILCPSSTFHHFCHQLSSLASTNSFRPRLALNHRSRSTSSCNHRSEWALLLFTMWNPGLQPC